MLPRRPVGSPARLPKAEFRLGLHAGDWVEVRSAEEILSTLDADGSLEALPFMPELLQYCGKRFKVDKSAHKSCDTLKTWRNRRMNDAVHLAGLRCTGEAHGGCQAGCLIYWKEAWLKRAPAPGRDAATTATGRGAAAPVSATPPAPAGCDRAALDRATRVPAGAGADTEERFRCQATQMFEATSPAHWDAGLYLKDITSGNVGFGTFLKYGLLAMFNHLRRFPHIRGQAGTKTPQGEALNLQAGDWVEVRSKAEILPTLNRQLRHRGLSFDIEMLPFCGKRFRVLRRVDRLIDDKTGKMVLPRSACLILEDVVCGGCLSRDRMFCPRAIYPYWHEVWLKRAPEGAGIDAGSASRPG